MDFINRLNVITLMFLFFFPWPVTSAFAGLFDPSNFWECILDEMPGVKNDPSAIEHFRKCRKKFQSSSEIEKKSPFIGVKTAGECVLKYAEDISSPRGAKYVRAACYRLYPKE